MNDLMGSIPTFTEHGLPLFKPADGRIQHAGVRTRSPFACCSVWSWRRAYLTGCLLAFPKPYLFATETGLSTQDALQPGYTATRSHLRVDISVLKPSQPTTALFHALHKRVTNISGVSLAQ